MNKGSNEKSEGFPDLFPVVWGRRDRSSSQQRSLDCSSGRRRSIKRYRRFVVRYKIEFKQTNNILAAKKEQQCKSQKKKRKKKKKSERDNRRFEIIIFVEIINNNIRRCILNDFVIVQLPHVLSFKHFRSFFFKKKATFSENMHQLKCPSVHIRPV